MNVSLTNLSGTRKQILLIHLENTSLVFVVKIIFYVSKTFLFAAICEPTGVPISHLDWLSITWTAGPDLERHNCQCDQQCRAEWVSPTAIGLFDGAFHTHLLTPIDDRWTKGGIIYIGFWPLIRCTPQLGLRLAGAHHMATQYHFDICDVLCALGDLTIGVQSNPHQISFFVRSFGLISPTMICNISWSTSWMQWQLGNYPFSSARMFIPLFFLNAKLYLLLIGIAFSTYSLSFLWTAFLKFTLVLSPAGLYYAARS